jgi:hypothetical protein
VSATSARRLAWAVFAGVAALLLVDLVLEWATRNLGNSAGFSFSGIAFPGTILISLTFFSFSATGVLIAARVPGNPVGWILLAISYGWGLVTGSIAYGDYALKVHPGQLPAGAAVAAVSGWVWARRWPSRASSCCSSTPTVGCRAHAGAPSCGSAARRARRRASTRSWPASRTSR